MILSLPFLHRVRLRAGTQRKPREYAARGYVSVDVPEISSSLLTEVVRISHETCPRGSDFNQAVVSLKEHGCRLFRAVEKDGERIDGRGLEMALAEAPHDAEEIRRRASWGLRLSTGLDSWPFPTLDVRHGEEVDRDPLRFLSHQELLVELEWSAHPPEWTDHHESSASAARHLSEAVLIVDGQVWTEHPEPVWSSSTKAHRQIRLSPDRAEAWDHHRLDSPPTACGKDLLTSEMVVNLFRPDLLRRDDVVELARAALSLWPRTKHVFNRHDGSFKSRIPEVDRVAAGAGLPSQGDCIAVLDAYVFGRDLLAAQGWQFRDRGRSVTDRAGAIAGRWTKERDAYFTREADGEFSAEDLDAMIGMDWTGTG